jgi:hypothetical protein
MANFQVNGDREARYITTGKKGAGRKCSVKRRNLSNRSGCAKLLLVPQQLVLRSMSAREQIVGGDGVIWQLLEQRNIARCPLAATQSFRELLYTKLATKSEANKTRIAQTSWERPRAGGFIPSADITA